MRRLIPPSPVRLTSEAVLEYTTPLLQEYLTFLAHAGHQWQTSDVWHILLAAAAQGSTIEAACSDGQDGPDANTIRQVLREGVTNDRFDVIEAAINTALAARLPRWLQRRPLDLAFDLHDEPYYGHAEEEADFICRGEAQQGTTRFYRCATAYVLARGVRFTLAVQFLLKTDRLPEVVATLRTRVASLGVRVRRLFFDKAFCTVELLRYLSEERLPAILAVPLRGKRRGVRLLCHGRKSYRTLSPFQSSQSGAITVPVCVVRTYARRRQGHRRAVWLVYVVLRCQADPATVRQLYRRRFGIEASYRLMEQVRIRTTSRRSAWRFLFMGLAILLITVWNLLQWLYTATTMRGRRELREGLFRLHRFIRFLLHAIDGCYNLLTAIEAET